MADTEDTALAVDALPIRAIAVPGVAPVAGALQLTDGLARVQLRYELAGGVRLVVGSGFIIESWRSSVITARHVIALPPGAAVVDLSVELRTAAGLTWVQALGCAYPDTDDEADDVAVIHLCQETAGVALSLAAVDPPEDQVVAAQVRGYLRSGNAMRTVPLQVSLSGGVLRYTDGQGFDGMSGGPVTVGDGVVAAHSQDDAAILLDFDKHLNLCHDRASEANG